MSGGAGLPTALSGAAFGCPPLPSCPVLVQAASLPGTPSPVSCKSWLKGHLVHDVVKKLHPWMCQGPGTGLSLPAVSLAWGDQEQSCFRGTVTRSPLFFLCCAGPGKLLGSPWLNERNFGTQTVLEMLLGQLLGF